MKQRRKFKGDFSYGGYAIFADKSRMPAYLEFKGGKLTRVSLAKKAGQQEYLHADCIKYDLTKKCDINRLKRKEVIGFAYDTPTELSLTYTAAPTHG